MIGLLSSATGAAMGGAFSLNIPAASGEKRMLLVSIATWAGAQPSFSASFNGVAGKNALLTPTGPAYLAMYYWLDYQLPGVGAFNVSASAGGSDGAASAFLLAGVDQQNPITGATGLYNASNSHPLIRPATGDAIVCALAALGTNTASADAPLGALANVQYNNAHIWTAFTTAKPSAPGFTTSGDLRTAIGAVGLRAYEYPKSKARLFVKKLPQAWRWWHGG